jgi:hypothetical protein
VRRSIHGEETDPYRQCESLTSKGKRCMNNPLLNSVVCPFHLASWVQSGHKTRGREVTWQQHLRAVND